MKQKFTNLCFKYSTNLLLINELWLEIESAYCQGTRYYHTLKHLQNLLLVLENVQALFTDYDAVLFAVYYHDLIYEALGKDNEEKSSLIAQERMITLGVPINTIIKTNAFILATKAHQPTSDQEINLFTDTDLSILGTLWPTYDHYQKQIRLEYAVYDNKTYATGRSKVLRHFLGMNAIYKTEYFYQKLEAQARENLRLELSSYGI